MRLATVLVLSATVAAGTIDVTNGWRACEEPAGAPRDWAAASASDGLWRDASLLEAVGAATWFRRAPEVPEGWHGLPLFLILGREAAGVSLYVNGAPARLLEREEGACFEVTPRAGKAPLLLALRVEAGHRGCRAALSTDPRLVVRGRSLFVTDELPVGRTPAPRAQPLRRLPTPALRAEKREDFTSAFTVFGIPAGRFLVGREAGSREVWSPSFKLFDDVRPYLIHGGCTVAASDYLALLETTPEGTTLTYALPFGTLRETVFGTTSGDIGTIYLWEDAGEEPVFLALRLSPLFVPMWPAPDEPLARSARWDSGGFFVYGPEGLVAVAGAAGALPPREASRILGTAGEFALVAPLERGRATAALFACAGSERAARKRLAGFLRDPLGQLEASRLAWRRTLEETTGVEVPDAALQDAYDWARVSLLQLAVTSRLGTGFVAGVGPSRGGGRPEFAWYFGRDSSWESFAAHLIGRSDLAEANARLEASLQREDGKTYHEVSLADWLVEEPGYRYPAGDATPFFVIDVYECWRHTGDDSFVEEMWPAVERALGWCYSVDTDGDLLIDNPPAGHQWFDYGERNMVDLVAIWARALRCASEMALETGRAEAAARLARDGAKVAESLNDEFWNAGAGYFYDRRLPDGTFLDDVTPNPCIAVAFGLAAPEKAHAAMRFLDSPRSVAPWGLRTLASDSPRYNPLGYHEGSVWPFVTGFASLAAYKAHLPELGLRLLRANARLSFRDAPGRIAEVLDGDTGAPFNVPHQGWSSSTTLQALLEGLFGMEVDARVPRLALSPHLPETWETAAVRNIHVGSLLVHCSVAVERERDRRQLRFDLESTGPLTCVLSPALPEGFTCAQVTVDNRPVPFRTTRTPADVHAAVELALDGRASIVFRLR